MTHYNQMIFTMVLHNKNELKEAVMTLEHDCILALHAHPPQEEK